MSKIDKPFLDPQKRVDLAVADLARRVKFAGLVSVISGERFQGTTDGSGNPTIWYETEGVTVARDYEWRTRTKPVEYDDIFRTKLPIKINKHMTQGVRTTPEQEYFDEITYARDVLPPATTALANRLNSKEYKTTGELGTGIAVEDCNLKPVGYLRDHCEWSNALLGAGESAGGVKVGAMTDARGCITEVSSVMPREYEIAVVWQGVTPSKANASTCGTGMYGDDRFRRVLVTTVRVACLMNDPATNTCVFPPS